MKFIKIEDQFIDVDKIISVYPSLNNDKVHINCGKPCAIFSFRNTTIKQILELLKKAGAEIIK